MSASPEGRAAQGKGAGDELVGVAYARDTVEAEMIKGLLEGAGIPSLLQQVGLNVDGPQLGFGLAPHGFGGGPRKVMVHADRAEQARALLAETLVEDEAEAWPEAANAEYLADAGGGKARAYGVVGAYARSLLWAVGFFVVAFGIFMLLRVV